VLADVEVVRVVFTTGCEVGEVVEVEVEVEVEV